ncbi:MAG: hypothetical protein LH467_08525 [Gemmatimonadaceae bacterium]|nr:hypothetical protein [Gemmatimonadaceae bacterium]
MTEVDAPSAWTMLAPPGWQRRRSVELLEENPLSAFEQRAREAGRADLVLQARSLTAELRTSLRAGKVIELYTPATVDAVEAAPASLSVAVYRAPAGTSPEAAATRIAKARPVERVDDAGALHFRFRAESTRYAAEGLYASHTMAVFPRPGAAGGLFATFTALHDGSGAEAVLALGDVMLASFTWRAP